jgi:hypothetical protein
LEAPEWVQQEVQRNGQARRVPKKVTRIPDMSGVYWIGGVVLLPDKSPVPAVLVTDTDAGGELLKTFWYVDERWYEQSDPDLPKALKTTKLFPYDYKFNVPLERDIFHGSSNGR